MGSQLVQSAIVRQQIHVAIVKQSWVQFHNMKGGSDSLGFQTPAWEPSDVFKWQSGGLVLYASLLYLVY